MLITFASEKGGVGKTTMAVHAAAFLSDLGHDVAFFDTDGRATTISWLKEARPSIAHLSTDDPNEAAMALGHFLDTGTIVVADAPPSLGPIPRMLLSQSDRVIVPSVCSLLDVTETFQTYKAFVTLLGPDEAHRGRDLIAFTNRYERGNRAHEDAADVLRNWGVRVATTMIPQRRPFNNAPQFGVTVFDMTDRYGREAADELRQLFHEVLPHELIQQRDAA